MEYSGAALLTAFCNICIYIYIYRERENNMVVYPHIINCHQSNSLKYGQFGYAVGCGLTYLLPGLYANENEQTYKYH